MPSKKISQLVSVPVNAPTDVFPIVQGLTTYKTTIEDAVNSLVDLDTDLSTSPNKLTDRATIKSYVDSVVPSGISYSSYVAIMSFQISGFTETILQNDFTGVTYTWSNPSTNVLRITPSVGTTFALNKTVVFVNSYDNDYLVTPTRTGGPTAGVVNLTHVKWDGTTNTMSYGTFFIEIRVYP